MAKKVIASFKSKDKKGICKVYLPFISEKTKAYTYKVQMISTEEVEKFVENNINIKK
jgi:hypothetical protein